MAEMDIRFELNGKDQRVSAEPNKTLLYLLRDNLGLTGTKDGCSSGDCGACVVMLDGRPVNSCMVLAAAGRRVIRCDYRGSCEGR